MSFSIINNSLITSRIIPRRGLQGEHRDRETIRFVPHTVLWDSLRHAPVHAFPRGHHFRIGPDTELTVQALLICYAFVSGMGNGLCIRTRLEIMTGDCENIILERNDLFLSLIVWN